MILGVTGTRRGMTRPQLDAFTGLLAAYRPARLHHGDCVGVDEEAAVTAYYLGVFQVVHPPSDPKLRAFVGDRLGDYGVEVLEPLPYLARNKRIVEAVDLLVVVPKEDKVPVGTRGSGTWSTVAYARWQGVPWTVVWWDGRVVSGGG